MAKQFRYPVDKALETKRIAAYRALYNAKIRFAKIDLQIRTGRKLPDHQIRGYVHEIPYYLEWVRNDIKEFRRARLEKRREQEARLAEEALPKASL